MAVTVSPVVNANSVNTRSFDIIASADADTNADIVHGIAGLVTPDQELKITFEPLLSNAWVSQWSVASRDQGATKTTVRVTKGTGVGSGNAGNQVRVHIQRIHSLVR
jgi:hypothetical protein